MPEDMDDRQWYTNKDLFEKLDHLKTEFNGLKGEMYETRVLIQNYNGLRDQIGIIRDENEKLRLIVQGLINTSDVKKTTVNDMRVWGGWIFGLITLAVLLYDTFK